MKQSQTPRKEKDPVKFVKIFNPERSSVRVESLRKIFSPWVDELYNTVNESQIKEEGDEKSRGNN